MWDKNKDENKTTQKKKTRDENETSKIKMTKMKITHKYKNKSDFLSCFY